MTTTPSPDGLQEPALREALEKAADAYEAFVTARNAMNAARPAIDATPAERALYDERYKADHAAEREHFSTAIQLAHFARSILATLPQQAATDEGEAQAEIGRLRTELDRFYNPADRNLSTSDPIVPLPGFDPRHLKGLALLFREWCGERMWGRPQEAELAARQVETAYLILSTPTSHPPAAETRMRDALEAIKKAETDVFDEDTDEWVTVPMDIDEASQIANVALLGCTCMEVFGEDPNCIAHGRTTNPEPGCHIDSCQRHNKCMYQPCRKMGNEA